MGGAAELVQAQKSELSNSYERESEREEDKEEGREGKGGRELFFPIPRGLSANRELPIHIQ